MTPVGAAISAGTRFRWEIADFLRARAARDNGIDYVVVDVTVARQRRVGARAAPGAATLIGSLERLRGRSLAENNGAAGPGWPHCPRRGKSILKLNVIERRHSADIIARRQNILLVFSKAPFLACYIFYCLSAVAHLFFKAAVNAGVACRRHWAGERRESERERERETCCPRSPGLT